MKNNFSKINKLKTDKDFANVVSHGKVLNSNIVCIKYINNHLPYIRYGLSISKKKVPLAVKRNKIKRQLREIIKSIHFDKNIDFVVMVKAEILKQDFHFIKLNVEQTFRKIH